MARREPRFQVTLDYDVTFPDPHRALHCSLTGFLLQIRKFLEDDNGNVREDDREEEFQEKLVLPEFVFGSNRHRNRVAHRLREAGWPTDERGLEWMLDLAFSDAKLILEKEKAIKKRKKKNSKLGVIPTIILRVKKFVSWEHELEGMATAMELSMQETPKPVPATKESIKALQKLKVQLEADGLRFSTEECIICMEQLSSGTNVTCMPCSHLFHGDCIEKWLNTSHQCPLCRFPMPTDASP